MPKTASAWWEQLLTQQRGGRRVGEQHASVWATELDTQAHFATRYVTRRIGTIRAPRPWYASLFRQVLARRHGCADPVLLRYLAAGGATEAQLQLAASKAPLVPDDVVALFRCFVRAATDLEVAQIPYEHAGILWPMRRSSRPGPRGGLWSWVVLDMYTDPAAPWPQDEAQLDAALLVDVLVDARNPVGAAEGLGLMLPGAPELALPYNTAENRERDHGRWPAGLTYPQLYNDEAAARVERSDGGLADLVAEKVYPETSGSWSSSE